MLDTRRESLLGRDKSALGSGGLLNTDHHLAAVNESSLAIARHTHEAMRGTAKGSSASTAGVIAEVNDDGTYEVAMVDGSKKSGVTDGSGQSWAVDMSVTVEITNGEPMITGIGPINLGKASDLLA